MQREDASSDVVTEYLRTASTEPNTPLKKTRQKKRSLYAIVQTTLLKVILARPNYEQYTYNVQFRYSIQRWLLLRLSKRQSTPTTVLLRTTLKTRTITQTTTLTHLGSNLSLLYNYDFKQNTFSGNFGNQGPNSRVFKSLKK